MRLPRLAVFSSVFLAIDVQIAVHALGYGAWGWRLSETESVKRHGREPRGTRTGAGTWPVSCHTAKSLTSGQENGLFDRQKIQLSLCPVRPAIRGTCPSEFCPCGPGVISIRSARLHLHHVCGDSFLQDPCIFITSITPVCVQSLRSAAMPSRAIYTGQIARCQHVTYIAHCRACSSHIEIPYAVMPSNIRTCRFCMSKSESSLMSAAATSSTWRLCSYSWLQGVSGYTFSTKRPSTTKTQDRLPSPASTQDQFSLAN